MPTQRDTGSGKIGMTNPLDDFAAMWNDHPEKAFKEMRGIVYLYQLFLVLQKKVKSLCKDLVQ